MKSKLYCLAVLGMAITHGQATAQWHEQSFPTSESLLKVVFFDTTTGWIAGSEGLYQTVDGGVTWSVRDTIGFSLVLCALDPSKAFHAPGMIRRTTDGGATWETVDSGGHYYNDMQFVTSDVGYAAGAVSPGFPRYGTLPMVEAHGSRSR